MSTNSTQVIAGGLKRVFLHNHLLKGLVRSKYNLIPKKAKLQGVRIETKNTSPDGHWPKPSDWGQSQTGVSPLRDNILELINKLINYKKIKNL